MATLTALNPHLAAFTEFYAFNSTRKREGKNTAKVISSIPLIGTIFSVVMLSQLKANKIYLFTPENKANEKKAFIARYIISLIGLGALLLLVDIIGTIVKASLNRRHP